VSIISSTDPIWSTLAAYYSGSEPTTGTTAGTASSAETGADANATPTAAQANASTMLGILGAPASSANAPTASSTLLSQVLDGQSSSAAVAVSSAVNQNILDMML
jgi:hypothetical protein